MKLIKVYGDDYGSMMFEDTFKGAKVQEIIDNPKKFTLKEFGGEFEPDDDEYWILDISEVGEVSPEFIKFFRNGFQDYDDSKHSNFWMEYETI